jgi:hypothetical protein
MRKGKHGRVAETDTFVDPNPFIPIMAIMASSSSFTASMASPSSGSPASACGFRGEDVDDCAIDAGQLLIKK